MKLVLHIFRKDVRHFWPEILLNLVLMVAFAWTAPAQWTSDPGADVSRVVPGLLLFLFPVAWFLLISRLLHDEALVGDRQFWITRPYRWGALLGAKALFLLAFVHLPFLLMQVCLLQRAGLASGAAFGELLLSQLGLLVIYVLPFAATGAVTAAFGGHVLVLLAGLVYLLLMVAAASEVTVRKMALPYVDGAIASIFAVTLGALVLWMYARRRARGARLVLALLPAALLLLFVFAPARLLVSATYPAAAPGALFFDPDPDREQPGAGEPLRSKGKVELQLPLRASGLAGNELVYGQGARLTLRAGNGFSWSSGWERSVMRFGTGEGDRVDVLVPDTVYDRLNSTDVEVRLQIAAQRYISEPAQTAGVSSSGRFQGPNGGLCSVDEDEHALSCRFAVSPRGPAQVTAELQVAPCLTSEPRHSVTQFLGGSDGGLDFHFNPVILLGVVFQPGYVCPGARVNFTGERLLRSEQVSLRQGSVRLALYATHNGVPSHR